MAYKFLIIGAGFSGAVLAEQLVKKLDCSIEIWDARSHIGGNCHTERDASTGIMVHEYGPHIFNTDKPEVWAYVQSFSKFHPYIHRVKAISRGAVYSFPLNLHTLNQFFHKNFTPDEARAFLKTKAVEMPHPPSNFEEQALQYIGKELYEAFFYGYTLKQWGCQPAELPAAILNRLPVRFDYNDNYYSNAYSGIPVVGYTEIIRKMIDHPSIKVFLEREWSSATDHSEYDHVFYTGPIDGFFDYSLGRLGYRTITFEKGYAEGDFQGAAQINYCDAEIPFTRITEHKHFATWEMNDKSVYFKEYSKETAPGDTPFYPKRLSADKILLKKYREQAILQKKFSFLGRLATYRYMDMQHVIEEALIFANKFAIEITNNQPLSVFSNIEFY